MEFLAAKYVADKEMQAINAEGLPLRHYAISDEVMAGKMKMKLHQYTVRRNRMEGILKAETDRLIDILNEKDAAKARVFHLKAGKLFVSQSGDEAVLSFNEDKAKVLTADDNRHERLIRLFGLEKAVIE